MVESATLRTALRGQRALILGFNKIDLKNYQVKIRRDCVPVVELQAIV